MKRLTILIATCLALILAVCACQVATDETEEAAPTSIKMMLDWVPNTNHTGLFVAQANGYFADEGLQVEIIQPGEVYAEQTVASGAADFGVSFQEQITLARADDVPIVSIAAIIQHNTSAFASRGELQVNSPADWAGLTYGSYGSPFEQPTLRVLMGCDGGDFEALNIVDTGYADPLALLDQEQIDLAWIFYAWQGVQAEQENIDLDVIMMQDWLDCIPDYYTPVLIASEETIAEQPQLVRRFLSAVSRGYRFAIDNPEGAAAILLDAVPELDSELVYTSQAWISPLYQADAARWGEQSLDVWQGYSNWMLEHNILSEAIDAEAAFTNEFLPEE
jgi:ABC-type nitrate/sulfonate/bicarbonate transport system substrate-binding protein